MHVLNPQRGLARCARVKVERRAHADHGRAGETLPVFVHPLFLFGRAQADEQYIGFAFTDCLANLQIFFRRHRPEGRGIAAGNLKTGETLRQVRAQRLQRLLPAAVEKEAHPVPGGGIAQLMHQRWSVNTLLLFFSERAQRPHNRHTVGRGGIRGINVAGEHGVVFRQNYAMGRRHAYIVWLNVAPFSALLCPLLAQRNHFAVTGCANQDRTNGAPLRHARLADLRCRLYHSDICSINYRKFR